MQFRERIERVLRDTNRFNIDFETQCWNWNGAKLRSGHPVVKIGGTSHLVYRLAYMMSVAPIPHGHQVHHVCHNPACINPAHLLAVTPGEHARLHGKLDPSKAQEIRRLYNAEGWTQDRIAQQFDVDQTTVSRVVTGKTWKADAGPDIRRAA